MLTTMTSDLDSRSRSVGDRARARAYHRDVWPGIAGYVIVLTAVITWGHLDGHSSWRYVWALLPVIPALWIVRAVVRRIGRIDDYQRLLSLRGLAVGFAIAMLASLTVGFLGIAGLELPAGEWIIYSAGMLGWVVTGMVTTTR
jgi:hypothetical protein